jgi:hypothetical protein
MSTTPMMGCSMCSSSAGVWGCPHHGPQALRTTPTATVTVTTRQVPVSCEVCAGRGYRPEMPDDPDGEWKQCDACQTKGWLTVTETRTERTNV